MSTAVLPVAEGGKYTLPEIVKRIEACPKLSSLKSVQVTLRELLSNEQGLSSEIADTIKRDPSLTARVLRLVNSVYFGLSDPVNSVEDAVFYLGIRHIRDLSYATPVIEELVGLHKNWPRLNWTEMWRHSVGTAFMTREVLATAHLRIDDETDYIIGLLHNVGKVIMAHAFPKEFGQISSVRFESLEDVLLREKEAIGLNHAEIGALFLQKNQLAPEIVESVRHHHTPENAGKHHILAAAVQVADRLVCHSGIAGGLENFVNREYDPWMDVTGWRILFSSDPREIHHAREILLEKLPKLPEMLDGLV